MGSTVIPASAIFAVMSDVRPGRFYSVDELAVTLRVSDRAALHEQLRSMVIAPGIHDTFKLCTRLLLPISTGASPSPARSFCRIRSFCQRRSHHRGHRAKEATMERVTNPSPRTDKPRGLAKVEPLAREGQAALAAWGVRARRFVRDNPGKTLLGAGRARLRRREGRAPCVTGAARPTRPAARATTTRERPPELGDQIASWSEALAHQTKEHPVRSVALALGAGYVLGGGLFSPLSARIAGAAARIGLRVAFVPFMTQSIVAIGETILARGEQRDPNSQETRP